MTFFTSPLNTRSTDFIASYQKMHELVEALRTLINTVHEGGDPKAQERHTSRRKLLARERINHLGIYTGVDMDKLIAVGQRVCAALIRPLQFEGRNCYLLAAVAAQLLRSIV